MIPDVSIIIPTYCEAENLPVLIPRLHHALCQAHLVGEILIVDDNSPDDTPGVCERLSKDCSLTLLVRRNERGLSSAVIHGMEHATGHILLVMDADLSHPPERVPDLVAALNDPAVDFVIGSRYTPGGSTDDRWGLFRWLNSRVATLLARPFTSARDPMAGFFALRRETFNNADRLDPIGYKIGLELLVKCHCSNIREVPIAFNDRLHGTTKLTMHEQVNYLRHLKRLFEYKTGGWGRLAQFILVGVTGSVIDLLSFRLLLLSLTFPLARGLAIWVAMTWNFYLNRRLAFSYARRGPIIRQYLLFCLACSLGALINWAVSIGLGRSSPFFAHFPVLAAAIGIVAGTGFNYALSSGIVFRRPRLKAPHTARTSRFGGNLAVELSKTANCL